MHSTVDSHMRAAMVSIVRAPMTSLMRTNMWARVPIVDGRGVIVVVVFIVMSLRKASGLRQRPLTLSAPPKASLLFWKQQRGGPEVRPRQNSQPDRGFLLLDNRARQ